MIADPISNDPFSIPNGSPALVHQGILLPDGEATISDTASELFKLIAPTQKLFNHGGRIVALVGDDHHAIRLDQLTPDASRSYFERFTKFFRRSTVNGKDCLRSAILSVDITRAFLASHEAKENLPTIRALSAVPVPMADGSIHTTGWSKETGIFVTAKWASNLILPTLEDAVALILGTQTDFCFVTDADKSRAIAAIIAPAIRLSGAIDGSSPLHVLEADQSQAGKGYETKVIGAIYGETLSPVAVSGGRGVGSLDESFAAALLRGRPLVVLDNLRDKLNSQVLESFITAEGPFGCRVPYSGIVEVDSKKYVLLATSNGIEGTSDISNRMLIIRLMKQPRGYRYQQYKEGDLVAHIAASRAQYIGAVLRVVSEWIRNGKQTTNDARHDLRTWCRSLDWIVQEYFRLPPLLDGHDAARQRISDPALSFLRNVCLTLRPADLIAGSVVYNASQLADQAIENGVSIPGLSANRLHDDGASAKAVGVTLGRLFREAETIEVDRWSVKREIERVKRSDNNGYFDQKSYRISGVVI